MCSLGKLMRVQPLHTMWGCKQIKQNTAALLLQPREPTPHCSNVSRAANKSSAQQSSDQLTLYPPQSLAFLSSWQPTHMQHPCQCSSLQWDTRGSAWGRGKVGVDTWLNTSFQHQAEPPTRPVENKGSRVSHHYLVVLARTLCPGLVFTPTKKKYCQKQRVQTIATTISFGCERPALRWEPERVQSI